MSAPSSSPTVTVRFHLGAEHVAFDAALHEALASLKQRALSELQIVNDPGVEYFLRAGGADIENETQTLGELMDGRPLKHVEFHIKKRPLGGMEQ